MRLITTITLFLLFHHNTMVTAQMITGVWHGKINRQKVEVKIIQKGDSLTGTSYYYESSSNYRRYSIKGYFDQQTNEVVWWDDQLIQEKSGRLSLTSPGKTPMLSVADFNCPGGSRMMLDGKTEEKESKSNKKGEVHLDKSGSTTFDDEWDFVIENYTIGGNDPDIIDSVAAVAFFRPAIQEPSIKSTPPEQKPVVIVNPPLAEVEKKTAADNTPPVVIVKKAEPAIQPVIKPLVPPVSIEEKFVKREKKFIKEIPITGDSIELRFYDNAEVDGDSISLFLDGILLFKNIRLTAAPYIIKLATANIKNGSELVMVAENLGAIPPNTSYMAAIINNEKYDAYLTSTEGSSALIRLVKPSKSP